MTWEDIMKNNANSKNKQEFVDEVVRNAERILDKYTEEYNIYDSEKLEEELRDVLRKLFDDLVQVNDMTWKDEIKKNEVDEFTRKLYDMLDELPKENGQTKFEEFGEIILTFKGIINTFEKDYRKEIRNDEDFLTRFYR